MPFKIISSIMFCVVLTTLLSSNIEAQTDEPRRKRKVASVVEIESRLDRPCEFEFNDAPFSEVMKSFREAVQANIVLDQSALDDSLSPDEPVTFALSHVHIRTALREILAQYNATYLLSDGLIKIVSKDVADDPGFCRRKVIDCRQLLDSIAKNEVDYPGQLFIPTTSGNGPVNGGVFNVAPTRNSAVQDTEDRPTVENVLRLAQRQAPSMLVATIKMSVFPDAWSDTNGDFEIQSLGGLLVISASEECLFETETLIHQIEKAFGE